MLDWTYWDQGRTLNLRRRTLNEAESVFIGRGDRLDRHLGCIRSIFADFSSALQVKCHSGSTFTTMGLGLNWIREPLAVGIRFARTHLHKGFLFDDVSCQMAAIDAAGVDADRAVA